MTTPLLICPTCGEENPDEAVMCWACYSPLPGKNGEGNRLRAAREIHEREARRQAQTEKAKDAARVGLLIGALVAWLASGYLPRQRFALIGVGLSSIVALFGLFKWEERVQARQAIVEGEDPVERILNTLLLYAVRDGASQLRLRAGLGFQVHYFIEGEWREQMRIPGYVWEDLHARLLEKTDGWQKPIVSTFDGKLVEFWCESRRDLEYPVAIVTATLHRTV